MQHGILITDDSLISPDDIVVVETVVGYKNLMLIVVVSFERNFEHFRRFFATIIYGLAKAVEMTDQNRAIVYVVALSLYEAVAVH